MPLIRILPTSLKNKIAAGEVIERPASVVRELVENSLDAGARVIRVAVEKGGRGLISVSDDGLGMVREDALLCLERHATSKLVDEEGLYNISTLGFRGEALPSIASISRFRLTTAPRGSSEGVTVETDGGEQPLVKPSPAVGTAIEVRDLFFNTPARRKFLKRDATENMHVIDAVTRLGLANPGVGFYLKVEGSATMELPPAGSLRERVAQVYGSDFMDDLVEVFSEAEGLTIEGFTSGMSGLRERRTHQSLFVNSRAITDSSLRHAVCSAYDGFAPRHLHPVFLLFVRIEPSQVDFNVHPAKREVRFAHKEMVYRHVRGAVENALRGLRGRSTHYTATEHHGGLVAEPGALTGQGTLEDGLERKTGTAFAGPLTYAPAPHEKTDVVEWGHAALNYGGMSRDYIYLGDTFVAYAENGGLTVIDHHAAHERVLYEKFLSGVNLEGGGLLFPRQVRLERKEHMVLMENAAALMDLGIEVEDFGGSTLVVRAMPHELEQADLRGILSEAAAAIMEGNSPGRIVKEAIAARIACHGSVRGSNILSPEEMDALIEALDMAADPEHCPHGRPTRVRMGLDELKKMFKRR